MMALSRWIELEVRVHRKYSIQESVVGFGAVCGAVLQNHRALLGCGQQCAVVGDVPLHMPGIGERGQWLGGSSEIKVYVSQKEDRRPVELDAPVLAEVRLQHNFFPWAGTVSRGRKFEGLIGFGKERELVTCEKRNLT